MPNLSGLAELVGDKGSTLCPRSLRHRSGTSSALGEWVGPVHGVWSCVTVGRDIVFRQLDSSGWHEPQPGQWPGHWTGAGRTCVRWSRGTYREWLLWVTGRHILGLERWSGGLRPLCSWCDWVFSANLRKPLTCAGLKSVPSGCPSVMLAGGGPATQSP